MILWILLCQHSKNWLNISNFVSKKPYNIFWASDLYINVIRDFKIGHYGRLGRLDRCHVTQKTRDLLPSSFWDGMFSLGFSS